MKRSSKERRAYRTNSPPADEDHRASSRSWAACSPGSGGATAPPILAGGLTARWDDEAYVYLEAVLTQPFDFGADITVHDGRVFIRLEK